MLMKIGVILIRTDQNKSDSTLQASIQLLFAKYMPDTVAEWLALLIRTRKFPGSNLATGDRLSSGFSASFRPTAGIVLKLSRVHFLRSHSNASFSTVIFLSLGGIYS
jgi:hypothetical protein